MKPFYLTLPSQGGDGNTTSSFTVNLPYEIQLPGEWEVGLVDVLYPTSWYNIHERNNTVELCQNNPSYRDDTNPEDCMYNEHADYDIPPGYYNKPDAILESLNAVIESYTGEKLSRHMGFYMDRLGRASFVNGDDYDFQITIHRDVADILGFKAIIFGKIAITADLTTSPKMQNLYVYTDLIEPQIVGNQRADLLCIIPAKERDLKAAHFAPTHIHYLPLIKNTFSRVNMDIRDVGGYKIPFASGHSVVKLHFRPAE